MWSSKFSAVFSEELPSRSPARHWWGASASSRTERRRTRCSRDSHRISDGPLLNNALRYAPFGGAWLADRRRWPAAAASPGRGARCPSGSRPSPGPSAAGEGRWGRPGRSARARDRGRAGAAARAPRGVELRHCRGPARVPPAPARPAGLTRHAVRAPAPARGVLVAAEEREDGPPVVALRRPHELGVPADLLLLPAHGGGGKGRARAAPPPRLGRRSSAPLPPRPGGLCGGGCRERVWTASGGARPAPPALPPRRRAVPVPPARCREGRRAAGCHRLSPTVADCRRQGCEAEGGWRQVGAHGSPPARGASRPKPVSGRAGAGPGAEGGGRPCPEPPGRGQVGSSVAIEFSQRYALDPACFLILRGRWRRRKCPAVSTHHFCFKRFSVKKFRYERALRPPSFDTDVLVRPERRPERCPGSPAAPCSFLSVAVPYFPFRSVIAIKALRWSSYGT